MPHFCCTEHVHPTAGSWGCGVSAQDTWIVSKMCMAMVMYGWWCSVLSSWAYSSCLPLGRFCPASASNVSAAPVSSVQLCLQKMSPLNCLGFTLKAMFCWGRVGTDLKFQQRQMGKTVKTVSCISDQTLQNVCIEIVSQSCIGVTQQSEACLDFEVAISAVKAAALCLYVHLPPIYF